MIDTHCHPYMNSKKSQTSIISDFFDAGGTAMVVIGTDLETSKKAVELADGKQIFASIGIHPCDVSELDLADTLGKLEALYKNNAKKVVAIGETGLDYYWPERDALKLEKEGKISDKVVYIEKTKTLQKLFFKAHIIFAKTYNLPFIIHNRDAKDDVLEVLTEMQYKNFIFHCYSENYEYAQKVLNFAPDAFLSFSGIVTFKNASAIQETAKNVSEKNILAETDSPFLTPVPFRGKEENEPRYTKYVIEKISELRGGDMEKTLDKNSKRAFGI